PGFDYGPVKEILVAGLGLCVTLGIVSDPTTKGASDSAVTLQKTDINQTAEDVIKDGKWE
ncbi:MAG: hypothetical protein EOM54_15305, partial [Clostridia bacterium]|nr:hypothetical protein [Clostridia bacterium]